MCNSMSSCGGCPLGAKCTETEKDDPKAAVEAVSRWAYLNPAEPGIMLTEMERRFVGIYIEKGYLWAARDPEGVLHLYTKCPAMKDGRWVNNSPVRHSTRQVMGQMFPRITYEVSPVCLPKLI